MILIGRLDAKIDILWEVSHKDENTGEVLHDWGLYKTIPASVENSSFGEKVSGLELTNMESLFFGIRYREDLKTTMRLKYDNTIYEIVAISPVIFPRKSKMIITCIAYEPDREV